MDILNECWKNREKLNKKQLHYTARDLTQKIPQRRYQTSRQWNVLEALYFDAQFFINGAPIDFKQSLMDAHRLINESIKIDEKEKTKMQQWTLRQVPPIVEYGSILSASVVVHMAQRDRESGIVYIGRLGMIMRSITEKRTATQMDINYLHRYAEAYRDTSNSCISM